MRFYLLLFFVFVAQFGFAQSSASEVYPKFENCNEKQDQALKECFITTLEDKLYENISVLNKSEDFKGQVYVLFQVTKDGAFLTSYIDADNNEIKQVIEESFTKLEKITPATFNGRATDKQFSVQVKFPRDYSGDTDREQKVESLSALEVAAKKEFDLSKRTSKSYKGKAFKSQVNIPFSHANYAVFDRALNVIGSNNHTGAKPYLYEEVTKYYDLESRNNNLKKETNTLAGRKLWNEHLVQLQGDDFWFTLDPVMDFQMGKDTDSKASSTYNNTRGAYIQGALGEKLSFSASVFESQGRFADYVNRYSERLKAFGPDPAIIPGRGIAKRFGEDAYDYPVAEGYLSYSPMKSVNIQFGHGKQFIGDGYRSLLSSDVSSPSPYLKLNTSFWRIKYTNTWSSLRDVRPEVTNGGAFFTKYVASHYLSYNVTKRFNLGLFETVMWANTNGRGFDLNYLNPVIFYRFIEFQTGQDAGNALLGFSGKYKFTDNMYAYGQFVLDEFSLDAVKAGNGSWQNKNGFQLGVKYFNAFKVKNLMLQAEFNQVRPYTYSHNSIVLNYGHTNQSLAHLWGSNFRELILIGHYNYKRWFGEAKLVAGVRGLDFNTPSDNLNYGGDIYKDYVQRIGDFGNTIGQGNKTTSIDVFGQVGYLVNPASNLKLFANVRYRDFNPQVDTPTDFNNSTVWFNVGLRTDLFNWYFDF